MYSNYMYDTTLLSDYISVNAIYRRSVLPVSGSVIKVPSTSYSRSSCVSFVNGDDCKKGYLNSSAQCMHMAYAGFFQGRCFTVGCRPRCCARSKKGRLEGGGGGGGVNFPDPG